MEQKGRILLVEDDPFLRGLLSDELAGHGYWVVTAGNGFDALEALDLNPVDAVITDIFMPDMDGLELIRSLRKRDPGIPVFALSGGTNHSIPEDYLKFAKCFGADEVFAKPVDMATLVTKLEQYCQRGDERLV